MLLALALGAGWLAQESAAAAVNDWLRAREHGDAPAMVAAERALADELDLKQPEACRRVLEEARAAWPIPYPRGAWTRLSLRQQACLVRIPTAGNAAALPLVLVLAPPEQLDALAAAVDPQAAERAFWLFPDLTGLSAAAWTEEAGRFRALAPLVESFAYLRVDRGRVSLVGVESALELAAQLASGRPHDFAALLTVGQPVAGLAGFEERAQVVLEAPDFAAAAAAALAVPARDPLPPRFVHRPADPQSGRGYWVEARRFDYARAAPEQPWLHVAVERGGNTIRLRGRYVDQVDLYLNDLLVDLDRPLQIVRNGVSYRFQAQRSLRTLLEGFYLHRDPSAPFPALVRAVDLPPPSR